MGNASSLRGTLSRLRLHELLREVQDRLERLGDSPDHLDALLEAVLAVASGVELNATLRRIVQAATRLVGCRYGALGLLDPDRRGFAAFVCEGLDQADGKIGGPLGQGLARLLVRQPQKLIGLVDDLAPYAPSGACSVRQPRPRAFLAVAVHAGTQMFGELYVAEKTSGASLTEDDDVLVQALATAAAVAVENARLYEGSRLQQRWRYAASEIRAELLAATEPTEVLQPITDRALVLADADCAVVAQPEDPEQPAQMVEWLVVTTRSGSGGGACLRTRIPVEGSACAPALRHTQAVRVARIAPDLAAVAGQGFGPALVLPLRASAESLLGVLIILRDLSQPLFDATQLSLAAAFADEAAVAVQMAEDRRRLVRMRMLADRDRIARDLHEHVVGRLFTHIMALQSVQLRSRSPEIRRCLADWIDHVEKIITEIRASVFDQHGGLQGTAHLRRRLQRTVAELTDDSGLSTTVTISGPLGSVPPDLADQADAVVREGLSNTVRHAHASIVTLAIAVNDDLTIDITDDGVGVPAAVARRGLRNLTCRAADVGGTFIVDTRDGGGTHLRWTVPLPSVTQVPENKSGVPIAAGRGESTHRPWKPSAVSRSGR